MLQIAEVPHDCAVACITNRSSLILYPRYELATRNIANSRRTIRHNVLDVAGHIHSTGGEMYNTGVYGAVEYESTPSRPCP